jgi:hypothetical protein
MKKILETIRGVVGVSGVILWEKRAKKFHDLLPARFEQDMIEKLCGYLVSFAEIRNKECRVISRFQSGWLMLHNHADFALMVLSKKDLNTTTLNLVAKSAIASLETQLGSASRTAGALASFQPEHGPALARAVNLSLAFFQTHISRFEIAELLRQAKTELLPEHPSLKHFSIDANGGVILIKGAEKNLDQTAVGSVAKMIVAVADRAAARCHTGGFNIEKLTAPLQPTLAELGFYQFFRESGKTHA